MSIDILLVTSEHNGRDLPSGCPNVTPALKLVLEKAWAGLDIRHRRKRVPSFAFVGNIAGPIPAYVIPGMGERNGFLKFSFFGGYKQ